MKAMVRTITTVPTPQGPHDIVGLSVKSEAYFVSTTPGAVKVGDEVDFDITTRTLSSAS